MKTVKFFIAVALLFCILMLASFSVFADADWSAQLNVKQTSEVSNDGTFSVRVSVSDITSKSGIVCAIFHVCYDPSAVELMSWKNAYPSGWDFSGNSSFGAEDWTSVLEDDNGNSYLMYTVMNTTLEQGVTKDDVLYTDLVFKVLSNAPTTTEILVTDISFMDKNLENDCILSDRTLKVDLESDESSVTESSDEVSQTTSSEVEESSEPEESSEIEESSQDESNSESDESSEDAFSEEPFESSAQESQESEESTEESSLADTQISEQSSVTESEGKRVTMTVLLEDIKDEYGVSALQFKLKYKPSLLKFIDYEIILPDNWDLETEYTEDLCSVNNNGDLMFCVMNYQVGCGVKADGVLGFRIEFEVKNVEFDPSLITMSDILLINDNLEDVAEEDYRLAVSYTDENGALSEDTFSSAQDEGKTTKIVIAVIACAVLLAGAVTAVVIIRKKKQA